MVALVNSMTIEQLFDQEFGNETFYRSNDGVQIEKLCPICFSKTLSCNIEKGLFNCWKCTHRGSLNTKGLSFEKKRLEVDYDLQVKILTKLYSMCTLDPLHRQYLKKRGIYNPDKYGIKTVPFQVVNKLKKYFTSQDLISSGLATSDGKECGALRAERILIPYIEDGKVLTIKSRVDSVDANTVLRYLVPNGTRLGSLLWHPPTLGEDVILTEGEMKAMATCEAGISCCAVSGIGCIKGCIPVLKKLIKKNKSKRLFVILDTDINYQEKYDLILQAVNAAKAFGDMSTILFLPVDSEYEKMDLDTFLLKYPVEYLKYLMEEAWINRKEIKDRWEKSLPELRRKIREKNLSLD